jgi:hypothetical protein
MTDKNETRLPFRLFEQGLGAAQNAVHATTRMMQSVIGRGVSAEGAPETQAEAAPSGRAEAPAPAPEPVAAGRPAPGKTATAPGALATALDGKAKAALKKASGESSVADGLALKDQNGRVPPDEELGPEPFKPQVGP